jgi:predicted ribosome quality control (RQC) complex YloA/Tae2 family protein
MKYYFSLIQKKKKRRNKGIPGQKMSKYVHIHEFHFGSATYMIYEGKNSVGNNYMLDICSGDNVWFHVSGRPSAHVILMNEDKSETIPKQVLKRCCCICKASTRTSDKVEVVYTKRENLKKVNNTGTVSFICPEKVKAIIL